MRPELHFRAMGTTCSLFGDGDLAEGERWVRSIAARITRFDESSELSRLNAAAAWVDISPELEQLLRASLLAFGAQRAHRPGRHRQGLDGRPAC
ncbi:MAG: FAD:protein FMN transferase [Chloroflexi bacterium]|nr:MAG: FAD:protein FMN transferase [Chloroflexota bacterium]